MSKTIALCANLPMEDAAWTMPAFGKRYPGSGWMKWLPSLDKSTSPRFMSGKQALHCVKDLCLPPSQVIVIQEENNPEGQELIRLGADARVNFCMESPIYASSYYDNPPSGFKHYLQFDGGIDHLYFPSFDDEDIPDPVPWEDRKFLCMVMANKHYSGMDHFKISVRTYKWALETQLHDYRYEAINYFKPIGGHLAIAGRGPLDLYGKGWPNNCLEINNKLATIRNYKFALCFENGSYPGYITEKIIDCLVAGVIPIYRGAPDIQDYIDPHLYIDASHFETFKQMEDHLRSIDSKSLMEMIDDGQGWLRKDPGRNYNNRIFAKLMLELCA